MSMTNNQERERNKWQTLTMFAASVVLMTSCISSKNFKTQTITVKSNPDASIFWSDGSKAQTKYSYQIQVNSRGLKNRWGTDSLGNGLVYISKYEYKKKGGKIIIAKAGYEPQEFKLKWDLKKPQTFMLTKPAKYHANEYFSLSGDASSYKKRIELLRASMFQDPENDEGWGLRAADALTRWEARSRNYEEALAYAQSALKMDSQDSTVQANFQAINQAIYAKAEKAMRRSQRLQQYNQNAQAWLQWGQTMSAQLSNQQTGGSGTTTSSIPSKNSNRKNVKGTSAAGALSSQGEHRAYNAAVSQLSRMKTGLDAYDDAMRRRLQSQMKSLRKSDKSIKKDPLEDWNGTK